MLERGPLLDKMITHELELAVLGKRRSLFVDRSILEVEDEMALD
jgi:hypothetical protein